MDDLAQLLVPGERVRASTRPHMVALVRRLLLRAAAIGALLLAAAAVQSAAVTRLLDAELLREVGPRLHLLELPGWAARAATAAAWLVLVLAVLDAVRWRLTAYAVTDQRMLRVSGVFARTSLSTPLDRIGDFALVQGWLGRRLDYGDLVLLSGGAEGGNVMAAAADVLRFQRTMQAARAAWLGLGGSPAAARRDPRPGEGAARNPA